MAALNARNMRHDNCLLRIACFCSGVEYLGRSPLTRRSVQRRKSSHPIPRSSALLPRALGLGKTPAFPPASILRALDAIKRLLDGPERFCDHSGTQDANVANLIT